ncbi:MAG TPA: hypothetical protein VKZ87_07845 [Ferrovibrio sp.]|uniref:hypothetical protein n=1 Tax=Ferrovibrio sp. TaxID=1917215 RepID=UPI002B4B7E4F|nr:hypothetical protein [Ferrovibrio sp.]HLT77284.1 hypothetical protein [Ferrovibrio sp.]
MFPFLLLFGLFALTAAAPQSGTPVPEVVASATADESGRLTVTGPLDEPEPRQAVPTNHARGTGVIVMPMTPPDAQGRSRLLEPLPAHAIIGKGAGLILERAPPRRP